MPFRTLHSRKLLTTQRRTGEPSPAIYQYDWYPDGHGKASGSYTEKMRQSLWAWMEAKYGSAVYPLTFEYKLYRKRTVTVVGTFPTIRHYPYYGKGKKGFILELSVRSIDGIPCRMMLPKRTQFAWDRVVGKDMFLALPAPSVTEGVEL